MTTNIEAGLDTVYSQSVLLALVDAGRSRDDAYRLVQEASATAWSQRLPLREVVAKDDRIGFGSETIAHVFNEQRMLRHAHLAVDALDGLGL
jgi:adenylosuccinate lyase